MKRLIVLLAGAIALIVGVVVAGSATPASAGIPNLGTLTPAPEPSNVGTAVTITPESPCPPAATDVDVSYSLSNGTFVDSKTITTGVGGAWTDTVTMDAAGDYFVDATCFHSNAASGASHLAVHGSFFTDGFYETAEFHVNGIVAASPNPATSGQSVNFSPTFTDPATGSRCPGGEVKLTITDPDGAAVVTDAAPTVAGDGSFTLAQILTKVGSYTVTGTCHRLLAAPTAGHLAAAQVPTFTNDFTYSGSAVVQAATTTTTTTVPEAAAAEAVEATPTFTG